MFKLSESNFTKWQSQSDTDKDSLQQHLLDIRESSNDAATEEDLLTEVLLKQGISLTAAIAHNDVAGLSIWTVGNNLVCAYLNENQKPTLDQLRAVAANAPAKLIVLEDAFQGSWSGRLLWMNPPYSRLLDVVHKCQRERTHAILVVPCWPRRKWFRTADTMAVKKIVYPRGTRFFEREGVPCRGAPWPICVFLLCGHDACALGLAQARTPVCPLPGSCEPQLPPVTDSNPRPWESMVPTAAHFDQ